MHEELSTAFPSHGSEGRGLLEGTEAGGGVALARRLLRRDRKKPDPFEPGGSGSCPKPPFQPLACALFSWAFLVWAAALGQPWQLPWCVQSLVIGVRGNYQRCQSPTSF